MEILKENSQGKSKALCVSPDHRDTFHQFFLLSLSMLALYSLIFPWMQTAIDSGVDSTYVSVPFFVIYASIAFVYMKLSAMTLKDIGFTLHLTTSDIITLIFGTFLLILVATFGKWILISNLDSGTGAPLFESNDQITKTTTLLLLLLYILFVPVQEFVARGIVLGRLLQCLCGNMAAPLAILISATIYSIVHSYMGIYTSVLVFIPGLVWGWMFYKTKSLLVVSVSHALCGLYVLIFLGLL